VVLASIGSERHCPCSCGISSLTVRKLLKKGFQMTKKQVSGLCALVTLVLTIAAANTVAHAQTFSVLYNFEINTSDPYDFLNPGTLAQGQDGNIYTTSASGGVGYDGGVTGNGTVFNMTTAGALSELYTFNEGVTAGFQPYSGVTLGTDGNFYGTTFSSVLAGCYSNVGCGTVFNIGPGGFNPLYNFTGGSDGGNPIAAPVEGNDGNFYGTSADEDAEGSCGTVYSITPSGLTTLYTFEGTSGCDPEAPLVLGADGNFYGTTTYGGMNEQGVVFKFTPPAGPYSVLYYFDGIHGRFPVSLVQGRNGKFYGTTATASASSGVVFSITSTGKLKVLHAFAAAGSSDDGQSPLGGLVQATDGNFYGTTNGGGTAGSGTIYRISASGSYSKLYDFDGTTAGNPYVGLLQHTDGTLYGLSGAGGTYNSGTFYSFAVPGLEAFVSLVSNSGAVGSPVGILGKGFTGTKKVTFTGGSATFFVVSDTYLTATVPSGAKLGFVTVKTPTGTLKSNKKFRVTP
jgi:uncharacterized repeat protein (TIGR03803 family)